MPKIMSALPSRAAAWAASHVPIYFDSSGTLRFLDGLDQHRRGAGDIVAVLVGDGRILRVAGRDDLGARVGGEGGIAGEREGGKQAEAENSFHEHGFLVPGRIERGSVNGAARRGLTKRQSPFAFAFSLSTSACEIFPACTRAWTQAGDRPGPALRMQRLS